MNSKIHQRSGFGYFFYGLELAVTIWQIRQFVLLPLLANILLVGGALFYLFSHLDVWIEQLMGQLMGFFLG